MPENDRHIYYTSGGRPVKDNGGIEPGMHVVYPYCTSLYQCYAIYTLCRPYTFFLCIYTFYACAMCIYYIIQLLTLYKPYYSYFTDIFVEPFKLSTTEANLVAQNVYTDFITTYIQHNNLRSSLGMCIYCVIYVYIWTYVALYMYIYVCTL